MSNLSRDHSTELSSVAPHDYLTPYVLRHLAQHGIRTVVDFARCDGRKLQSIANLPADQVHQLKEYLMRQHGPTQSNCLDLKDQHMNDTFVLSTGLFSLDTMLTGGGLLTGSLVELCGPTAGGKTLLADSIALHFVRTHRVPVYYVSTKNACSGLRWFRLLKAGVGTAAVQQRQQNDNDTVHNTGRHQQQLRNSDIAAAMSLLRCESVHSMHELQLLLRGLLDKTSDHSDYQLLIVDSLSALLLPFQGSMHKAGLSQMTETLGLLRQLADQQRKCVLVETLVLSDRAVMHSGRQHVSTISRVWPSFASIRLFISRHRKLPAATSAKPDEVGTHAFEVMLLKSNNHCSGPSVACVIELGVESRDKERS